MLEAGRFFVLLAARRHSLSGKTLINYGTRRTKTTSSADPDGAKIGSMKALLSFCGIIAALFVGCSKSGAAKIDVESEAKANTIQTDNPVMKASLEDINKKIEQQQYDAAVGALLSMNGMPKTDAEQNAYMNQVRLANTALSQRAAAGDQSARASQQMLGRFLMGR
jgi:hypothetical protein